jgi:hypothetical protein
VEVRNTEHLRREAIRSAENAAIGMMVALRDVQTYSDKLDRDMRALGVISGETAPDAVHERFSRRLTAVLRPLLTSNRYYGQIEFPEPQDCFAGEWEVAEVALLAPDITKALQPTAKQ